MREAVLPQCGPLLALTWNHFWPPDRCDEQQGSHSLTFPSATAPGSASERNDSVMGGGEPIQNNNL